MSWLIFAFINVIMSSVASLYQKIAMREENTDAVVSATTFMIVSSICYFIYALIKGFHIPSFSLLPFFIITATLYAVGTILFFNAIKKIEASEMTIISGFGPIVTIIASIIFLKDTLTFFQLIGVACILVAVILINLKKKGFVINRGTWLALLGTACYGIAVISDTVIIHRFEVASFIPIGAAGSSLIMMLVYPKKIALVFRSLAKVNKNLLFYSLLYAIGGITFYLAIDTGALVGQVSTVARASIILTVILSTIFLGERTNILKKLFGAILTTIGVILVSQ